MRHKIMLVGEAYGKDEERERLPFVGAAGHELNRMLTEAGIERHACYLTNVFNFRPENNDVDSICTTKTGDHLGLPAVRPGKYIRAEYRGELERLQGEILDVSPNVIVALGNVACWAILGTSGIGKIRGAVGHTVSPPNFKCVPAYHPAAILRQWELRPVTVLDLAKARRESAYPEVRRPERIVYVDPTLEDLDQFEHEHLRTARIIAFDIETSGDQITCIGFAPSRFVSIVVPFVDYRAPGNSYWAERADERAAWKWVRRVLNLPARKLAQNGLYDVNFLWKYYGITVRNWTDDTMLMHHALQPESLKGLGFLGSCYTNEASWKLMNGRTKSTETKRDA